MTLVIFFSSSSTLSLSQCRESCPLLIAGLIYISYSCLGFQNLSLLLLHPYVLLEFHVILWSKILFALLFWLYPHTLFPTLPHPILYFFVSVLFWVFKSVVKNIKLRAKPEPCTCKLSPFLENQNNVFPGKQYLIRIQGNSPSWEWDTAGLLAIGKERSKRLERSYLFCVK